MRNLIARNFVSQSGNVAAVDRLVNGGIETTWKQRPSDEDIAEFNQWIESHIIRSNQGYRLPEESNDEE